MTVLEMLPAILPGVESDITAALIRILKKKGVSIITSAKVTEIKGGDTVSVSYELNGKTQSAEGACCIVSVGRSARTKGIGLEELGIEMNRAFVAVDDCMQTSIPNIYAIGDITGKIQLAHVASAQGMVAAAHAAGKTAVMDYRVVPACIYTSPEIASVGMNVEQAEAAGYEVETGSFNVAGNGRAMVMGENSGSVKLIAQKTTGRLLGAQPFAPGPRT